MIAHYVDRIIHRILKHLTILHIVEHLGYIHILLFYLMFLKTVLYVNKSSVHVNQPVCKLFFFYFIYFNWRLRDGMWREVGGGFRMGNTCKSMADSCQCMAKTNLCVNFYI